MFSSTRFQSGSSFKSRYTLIPLVLTVLLSGCVSQQQKPLNSEVPPEPQAIPEEAKTASAPEGKSASELLAELEGYRTGSLQNVSDLGLATELSTTPVSQWRSWQQPVLNDFHLWDRVLKNFKLDLDQNNPRIQAQLNWYKKHPRYLERVFTRAERYMFHVVEQIEQRGLPGELAFLPIVESAYDPFAYSHGRASGMWQFIPSTARYFGLRNDWWYDGRRDVLDSTDKALGYLERLNTRFKGDWLHALAAYNAGGGSVNKAIRKNREAGKDTSYWNLRLPAETKAYVPKLIALAKLIRDADHYGLKLKPIANKPYFAAVETGGQIDLAEAARMADMSINDLYLLNPGFSQWATSPDGPHRLLVPVDKAAAFEKKLAQLPSSKRLGWQRYTIKSGDSLIRIAKKFNTTPQMIRQTNNIRGNRIRAGKKLLIPIPKASAGHYALSAGQRLQRKQDYDRSGTGGKRIEYKVKSGDSFWSLSRKHKVSMRQIARWNGMAPTDILRPGKKLIIWSKGHISASKSTRTASNDRKIIRKVGYKVRQGDSLARIASKFQVSINQIVGWNKINKKKYLQPGQKLTLYVDVTRNQ